MTTACHLLALWVLGADPTLKVPTAPADWTAEEPTSDVFVQQYRLEPIGSDKEYVRVAVTRPDKADTSRAFVKRWVGRFLPPEVDAPKDFGKPTMIEVAGVKVTYLDMTGVYRPDPNDSASIRQNYRLLAAYFAVKDAPFEVRMLGPAASVDSYRKEFEGFIKSFK